MKRAHADISSPTSSPSHKRPDTTSSSTQPRPGPSRFDGLHEFPHADISSPTSSPSHKRPDTTSSSTQSRPGPSRFDGLHEFPENSNAATIKWITKKRKRPVFQKQFEKTSSCFFTLTLQKPTESTNQTLPLNDSLLNSAQCIEKNDSHSRSDCVICISCDPHHTEEEEELDCYRFIITTKGQLLLGINSNDSEAHSHSSLAASPLGDMDEKIEQLRSGNVRVLAAGELGINSTGQVRYASESSGHFRMTEEQVFTALIPCLEAYGVLCNQGIYRCTQPPWKNEGVSSAPPSYQDIPIKQYQNTRLSQEIKSSIAEQEKIAQERVDMGREDKPNPDNKENKTSTSSSSSLFSPPSFLSFNKKTTGSPTRHANCSLLF